MAIGSTRVLTGVAPLLQLTRPGLTGMVAFSALVAYLCAALVPDWSVALSLFFGIALLSAAASTLNQVQERDSDARMTRTRLRPLATGRITKSEAWILASGTALPGLILLAAVDVSSALTGFLALLLYNGAYTPLKRYSSLALLPGALSGALPVAAGWLAAGSFKDPRLFALLVFMVLWQIPHSVCLAIREREDYAAAGLALVPASISTTQLVYLCRLWIAALAVGGLLLVGLGLFSSLLTAFAAIASIVWLLLRALVPVRVALPETFAADSGESLKLFLALFLVLLLVDALLF